MKKILSVLAIFIIGIVIFTGQKIDNDSPRWAQFKPLELVAVRRTPQEGLYDGLIAQHHYLGPAHGVGEQAKYLAFSQDRPLACLGFTSAPRHLGPRDRFIGWSPAVRRAHVHELAYNTRFLILPWVECRIWPRTCSGPWRGALPRTGKVSTAIRCITWRPSSIPSASRGPAIARAELAGPRPDHRAGQGRLDPSPQPLMQAGVGVAAAPGLPPPPGGWGHEPARKGPPGG